jgi:hypothetical protein
VKNVFKKWKKFNLNERNYTPEELASDNLWNDLSQEDIDGFFWNARGDGSLDYYTDLLLDLSDEIERDVGSDEAWQSFRDEVMSYKDIGEAYSKMAPEVENPVDISTAHDSPGAPERQAQRSEEELHSKAQELITRAVIDIQKEFADVELDDILNLFSSEIEGYEFRNEE